MNPVSQSVAAHCVVGLVTCVAFLLVLAIRTAFEAVRKGR